MQETFTREELVDILGDKNLFETEVKTKQEEAAEIMRKYNISKEEFCIRAKKIKHTISPERLFNNEDWAAMVYFMNEKTIEKMVRNWFPNLNGEQQRQKVSEAHKIMEDFQMYEMPEASFALAFNGRTVCEKLNERMQQFKEV